MNDIAAGKPIIDFIKLCYAANRPPLLCGVHGVGKSELFEQAAEDMKIDFIVRDLCLMEPPDLVGLPKMNDETTKFLPPEFLPRGGKGLIVFEELNRCDRFVRAPCLQLLTARSLNDYTLPEGWLPAAAINPADGDAAYEVFELDAALVSRFAQVDVIPDRDLWLDWARRNHVHPAVVDYVNADPTVFDAAESNPRAWKYVSDILTAAEKNKVDRAILRAAIAGQVGRERGAAFLRVMKQGNDALTAEQIINCYDQHRPLVKEWIKTGKLDVVKASLMSVQKYLQPKADYQQVHKNRDRWRNLARFVYDLPGDLHEEVKEFFREREYKVPRRPNK